MGRSITNPGCGRSRHQVTYVASTPVESPTAACARSSDRTVLSSWRPLRSSTLGESAMTIDAIDRLAAANPVVDLPGVVPVAEVLRIADAGQQPHEHGVAARRKWRRMPLAAAALATAGAAIVAAIALGAGTSPPAYAVSGHPDGTVTATMNELIRIAVAHAAPTELGVKATVVKIEP